METSNELFTGNFIDKENQDENPKESKESAVTINEDDDVEEDVDDLQVAWETLEFALVIITKHIQEGAINPKVK